jgi:hypothetical protein
MAVRDRDPEFSATQICRRIFGGKGGGAGYDHFPQFSGPAIRPLKLSTLTGE